MGKKPDVPWLLYFAVAGAVVVAAVGLPRWIARAKTQAIARRIVSEHRTVRGSSAAELFELQPFLFTVRDRGKQYRVNIRMSLAYDPSVPGLSNEILQRRADIWFDISDKLQALKKSQMDEETDKTALKETVKAVVNSDITNGQIENVYFREFLISAY